MTPAHSANFSAYPLENRSSPVGESAGDSSSGNLNITPKFMVRHATGPSPLENPRSFRVNDVPQRHTACATKPVLSIPAGRGNAPNQLPWDCASEQLVDQPSTRISPVAGPEIVAYPHPSDDATFDDTTVGRAAEIIPETDSRAESSAGGVHLRQAYQEDLMHVIDGAITALRSMSVSDADETIPREAVLAEASDGSQRCPDTRPEEFSTAIFRELLQRGVRIQEPLQSVAGQSPGGQRGTNIPSGNGVNENVTNGSDTAGQLAGEQTKPGQAQSRPPQHTAEQKEQEDGALCNHYRRRCYVLFPCCGKYFACHRCHNETQECDSTVKRANAATHLKCAECQTEQLITENSHCCSTCKIQLSEYFCGICKHFTCKEKNPYHCDKCGICRIYKERSFHCDVCDVCLDIRLQGKHTCRPDSKHAECCICFEDTFSGCRMLPCLHKVHEECGIAMVQNGIITCPICRHPLFTPYHRS